MNTAVALQVKATKGINFKEQDIRISKTYNLKMKRHLIIQTKGMESLIPRVTPTEKWMKPFTQASKITESILYATGYSPEPLVSMLQYLRKIPYLYIRKRSLKN